MCGRAGLTVPPEKVAGAVRSAGCDVPAKTCATYRTSSAKKADGDSFPCVVAAPGGLDLATLDFGVKKLRCHNAFVEGWLDRKTWREAAATPRGRCSMVVTSFVEGITARKPDDAVFFILGLRVGDEFVILTTAAKRSALLGERARAKEGWGAGRYPIVADGARAAAWATADGPEAAHRPGQDKRAKFPTSKADLGRFHSFWLIFGRAIISRNGLEARMLFSGTRARGTLMLKRT